jgi:hypothetical protein
VTRIIASALVLCAASIATAAPPDFEIFGGLGVWQPSLDGLYDASYTPSRVVGIGQLFQEPDSRSRGTQSLALQGGTGPGISAGFNVFLFGAKVRF